MLGVALGPWGFAFGQGGFALGQGMFALGSQSFSDTNVLVSPVANCSHLGADPMSSPNARSFALKYRLYSQKIAFICCSL